LQSNTHHYLSYCALAIIFSSLPTFQISLNNSWSLGINLSQIHHSLYSIMHAVSHSLALPIQLYLPLRPNLYNCLFKVLSLCLLGHERVTHSGYPEKQVCHRSCWWVQMSTVALVSVVHVDLGIQLFGQFFRPSHKISMWYMASSRYPTFIHDIFACYCGYCLLKWATSPYHQTSKNTIPPSQQSATIPNVSLHAAVSHPPSVFIHTHTATTSSLHHQFANEPCANQGFCTQSTPLIAHIWKHPPDSILLS
jgi:hypothetical protein